MNSVEFLAFVGAPLMLLATGVGVLFPDLAGWTAASIAAPPAE